MYEIYWSDYNSSLTGYCEGCTQKDSLSSALVTVKQIARNGGFNIGVRVMANGEWFYLRLPLCYSY